MTSDKEVFTALCGATDLGKTLEGGYKEAVSYTHLTLPTKA